MGCDFHGHRVKKKKGTCKDLESIPEEIDLNKFLALHSILEKCAFCPGNPDRHFMEMVRYRKNKFLSVSWNVNATVETGVAIYLGEESFQETIRSIGCDVFNTGEHRILNVLSTGHSYV